MPKGIPNNRYTGEFKQMVVETTRNKRLGCAETARRVEVTKQLVRDGERIHLTEGLEALHIERRGRGSKSTGRTLRFNKQV